VKRIPPAIIILGQNSQPIAKKISAHFPGSQIYGLIDRTNDTDINFSNFGETLRELFATETPIIASAPPELSSAPSPRCCQTNAPNRQF
jgi:cobalt-precorrin 5A hydrolase/precorrin-3B C17-methyltransferase